MSDHRLAGVSYPNGPADDAFYLSIPGGLLMLDSEARWHVDRFHAAGRPVVWRSMATPPARVGWSVSRYVDAVLQHVGEQQTSLDGGLIFANEWNLSGERGDHEDDWQDVERRYTFLNAQIIATAQMLRSRVRCELWYPAWSPHQFWRENVERWAPSVEAVDVLAFHGYETLEAIQDTYHWLRERWPDKKLACTEWNCREGGEAEIRRVLEWFAQVEQTDPNFIGAYYFIGKWYPPADSWTSDLDLEGHANLMALFRDPPTVQPAPTPTPEPAMPDFPLGIDVSNNNGAIDWDAVAADGVQFAIAKVTEGTGFVDRFFAGHWAAMRARGIIRGAYHFARPSANAAVDEARFFWDTIRAQVGGLETGDLLALDLEDDRVGASADLGAWTLEWLQEVERLAGFKPLCYTSPGYAAAHRLANRTEIGDFGLWMASWGVPTPPQAPAPWSLVAIHQTGVGPPGTIPGVAGEIDLDRYNGPIDTLPLYGRPATTPTPAPAYAVGPGILAAMQAHGDQAASDEVYTKSGSKDAWSEAVGVSGAVYRYLPATGAVHRYDPAA